MDIHHAAIVDQPATAAATAWVQYLIVDHAILIQVVLSNATADVLWAVMQDLRQLLRRNEAILQANGMVL